MASPVRTCIGCRRVRRTDELIRVVRVGEASLQIGRSLSGRGAWLCHGPGECLDQAARQGSFARAFRARVRPSAIDALRRSWPAVGPGSSI